MNVKNDKSPTWTESNRYACAAVRAALLDLGYRIEPLRYCVIGGPVGRVAVQLSPSTWIIDGIALTAHGIRLPEQPRPISVRIAVPDLELPGVAAVVVLDKSTPVESARGRCYRAFAGSPRSTSMHLRAIAQLPPVRDALADALGVVRER